MSKFSINSIVNQLGTVVYVVVTGKAYSTDYGDRADTRTEYASRAVVQVVDGSENMLVEGFVQIGDIVCYFDEAADNVAYLKNENEIKYGTSYYRIYNMIANNGHYEVYARKY